MSILNFFWFANAFSKNLNTMNLNIFPNYGGIYRFDGNQRNTSERESYKGSIELWGDVSLRLILKDHGGSRIYVYLRFFWSRRGSWNILWKRGGKIIKCWFLNRGFKHVLHTCIGCRRKFHAEPVCFYCFFGDKKE